MMRHLAMFVLLLSWAAPACAVEIFYPADGTYVVHSDFLIVKAGDEADALTLEIGGEKSDLLDISSAEYKDAFGDFLIVQPSWEPGKNRVKVETYKAGKRIGEKAAEFFYQNDMTDPPPKGYKRFVMHKPEQEAFCAGCHNMNPTPAEQEKVGADNPCASCHKRILERKNVHGPAGAWQCAYCHDAKSKPVRYAPRQDDASLCIECHDDMAAEQKEAKFVHGPVEVRMCSLCHDAHASDFKSQVLANINVLCLGCHEGIDKSGHVGRGVGGDSHPLSGQPDPSNPSRELSCASCHNPHSGAVEYYFNWSLTSRMMLCQKCHKK